MSAVLGSVSDGRRGSGGIVTVRSAARGIPPSAVIPLAFERLLFLLCPCPMLRPSKLGRFAGMVGASSSRLAGKRDARGASGGLDTRLMLSSSSAGEMTTGDWETGEVGGGMGAVTDVAAEETEGVRLSFASG